MATVAGQRRVGGGPDAGDERRHETRVELASGGALEALEGLGH